MSISYDLCFPTIDPWITDDHSSFRQAKLCKLGLDTGILQSNLLHLYDLVSIGIAVDVWSKTEVALHLSLA